MEGTMKYVCMQFLYKIICLLCNCADRELQDKQLLYLLKSWMQIQKLIIGKQIEFFVRYLKIQL